MTHDTKSPSGDNHAIITLMLEKSASMEAPKFIKLSWSLEQPTFVNFWFEMHGGRTFCYEMKLGRKSSTRRDDLVSLALLNRQGYELLSRIARLARLTRPFDDVLMFENDDGKVHLRILEIGWMSFCNLTLRSREKNAFLVNSKSHGNDFFPYAIGKKDPVKEMNEIFIEVIDESALKSINTLLSYDHSFMHTHVCKYHSIAIEVRNSTESFRAMFETAETFGNLYKKKWLRRVGYEGHDSPKITLVDQGLGLDYGFSIDDQISYIDTVRIQNCVSRSDGKCRDHLGTKEDPDEMKMFLPIKGPEPISKADLPFIFRPDVDATFLIRMAPRQVAFRIFDEKMLSFGMNPGLAETSHFRETYAKLLGVRSRITIHGIDNHVVLDFHKLFVGRSFPNVRILVLSTSNRSDPEVSSGEEKSSNEDDGSDTQTSKCDRLTPGDHSGCSMCHYREVINVVGRELSEDYGLSREALHTLKRLFPKLECLHIDYAWLNSAASVPVIEIFGDAWHPTYYEESSDDEVFGEDEDWDETGSDSLEEEAEEPEVEIV